MAKYKLKNYQKGFEVDQEKIGLEVTKDWDSFHQSSADELARNYSQSGFDPETRHYCFHEDKMIGFLVSKVLPVGDDGIKRAELDFPIVLSGHEEAIDLLYEKAISTLKNKGVKIVDGRAGYYWKGTIEKAKKYNHKLSRTQFCRMVIDLTAKNLEDPEFLFEPYNDARDRKEAIDLMMKIYNMTEEQANNNIDAINKDENKIVFSYLILRQEGKIVSRGLVTKSNKPNTLAFRAPTPDLKYLKSYVSQVVKLAKNAKYEILELFFAPENFDWIKDFAEAGFSLVGEINFYEKKL
ncbi:MAG TPA: hypothetical protein VMZ29_04665 [Candidatus Bathyarchaeia archaeon]|nr:hypothetical protein [Candidatus Bathyarchaeia archaeon]